MVLIAGVDTLSINLLFCYLRDITAAVWISVHIEAAPGFSVHVSGFRVTLQRIP